MQSITRLRSHDDAATLAYALNYLAVVQYVQGDYESGWSAGQEALDIGVEKEFTYSQAH